MRHHTEHVTVEVAYTRNIVASTVRICFGRDLTALVTVPKYDLVVFHQPMVRGVVAGVIPFCMGYGQGQHIAVLELVCKRGIFVFDAYIDVFADEMQVRISYQSTRQQAAFAQDLKAVADTEYELTFRSKIRYGLHHWRKSRQGTRSQIIAVREPARDLNGVVSAQIGLFVPYKVNGLTHVLRHDVISIVVAVGTGKHYNTKFHTESSLLIS
jgi:hypothetical protein